MFDNSNPLTNGEQDYFESIADECKLIFDVGCGDYSVFTDFGGVVHYFEPDAMHVDHLKLLPNSNASSVYNQFELGGGGAAYMAQKKVDFIDFLKIDAGGNELQVIKGFGEALNKVHFLQFEYGGTYISTKTKLADVIVYLQERGFSNFAYLAGTGFRPVPLYNFIDHYRYCNIVCEQRGRRN